MKREIINIVNSQLQKKYKGSNAPKSMDGNYIIARVSEKRERAQRSEQEM